MFLKKKFFDSAPIEIQRKQRTADGFLDVWGVAARVGTMDYPEHGFAAYVPAKTLADAAPLLVGQPVTIEHPEDGVTPDNARHTVAGTVLGSTFDEPSGEHRVHIRLYDAAAIALVESDQKAELSPGYDVSYRDATPEEETAYAATKIQSGRVYNHLACVEFARGGPTTRLNIDSRPRPGAGMPPKIKDAEPLAPVDMAPVPEAKDAPPPFPPAEEEAKDAEEAPAVSDAQALRDMAAKMLAAADVLEPPKKAGDMEKPPALADSLARHMRALDAAKAVSLDVAAHKTDTLAIERAVAATLIGDKAKTADGASLALLMDAACASGARGARISDLSGGRPAAQDAAAPEFKPSPEQNYARGTFGQPRKKTT